MIDGVLYDMAAPTVTHQEIAFEIAVALQKYIKEKGGKCKVFMAPDMFIEITSPSTRKKDFGKKLGKYVDAGVREYWIVDAEVSVGIYGGECRIDFWEIVREMENI